MSSLSSLIRFYASQHMPHERLPSSTSCHSWFSFLIAAFRVDCSCSPPWLVPARARVGARHSLPASVEHLDLEAASESAVCTKTECLTTAGFHCLSKNKKAVANQCCKHSCHGVGTQETEDTTSVLRSFRPFLPPPRAVSVTTKYLLNLVRECGMR